MRRALTVRPLVGPLLISALAVGFFARVAWQAIELDPLPGMRAPVLAPASVPTATSAGTVDITPAVELDPFRADRRRPPARYAIPGDAPPSEKPQAPAPGAVTLLGTVMSLDGSSFAMVGVAGSPPRVVRVGQAVGDLTLKKVEQGKAVFRSASGDVVTLTVPKAGQ